MSSAQQKIAAALLGAVVAAILLESTLWISSTLGTLLRGRAATGAAPADEVRILCLGDSMTFIGGYPAQLEDELNRLDRRVHYRIIDRSRPGIGSLFIAAHVDENLNAYHPDAVIVMIGADAGFYRKSPQRYWWWKSRTARLAATAAEQLRQKQDLGADSQSADWRANDADAGIHYFIGRDYRKATELLKKAAGGAEHGPLFYLRRAAQALERSDAETALDLLNRGMREYPEDRRLLKAAYWTHYTHRNHDDARRLMQKAVAMPGADWDDFASLSYLYLEDGDQVGAGSLHPHLRSGYVPDDRLLRCYAILALSRGDEAQARLYFDKADELLEALVADSSNPDHNRETAQKILSRKLPLFWMQYPVRRVSMLKKSLVGLEGIRFVDNEAPFKKALRKTPFTELFADQYGGDFGHLSPKGVKLLVGNLSKQILKADLRPAAR